MKKKLTAFLLALMMLTQVLVPGSAWAKESKSYPETDSNLVQVGMTGAENYPKLTNKVILDIQKEATLNSRKNMQDKTGVVPFNTPYLPGQEIPDKDKPRIVGNVSANFTTKGLDDGTFDWEGVFGKDSNGKPGKAKLVFKQWLKNQETGISYQLEVNEDGKYSWTDWEGKPARIPLYSQGLEAFTYSVYLDQDVSDKVKLLTYRIAGAPSSPGYHKDPETGLNTADIVIDLSIQQVASTKFVSEWHTGLEKDSRPPVEGEFDNKIDEYPGYFPFSKEDGGSIIIRNDFINNSDYEDPGYSEYGSSSLTKTPVVKVTEGFEFADENDEEGSPTYVFDEANKIIQTIDKKHKFKYDFTYDVINGGKLTMTEIIPLTFDANGGKFDSITDPNAEQKIVKEVEYDKDLTEDVEKPKKERETFKGWATEAKGKALSDEEFNKAIKNVKAAKTFYAVWDNNDIQAEELEVKESFKDGDTWVNDFIPTLDQLKGQVKIKDASGDFQALTDDDKFAIVDGTNEYTTDGDALKNYLYGKLQEKDDGNKPSRIETVKAKITHKNGTSQTVDIPIKVIKNIYEAKTLTEKPIYVPENYVKVTVDPTTKAEKPQKYFYYVNPKAKVVIPGKDPVGTGSNTFVKWTYDDNGKETEYKLAEKPRHQFENPTTITAEYTTDVIPQEGDKKPDTVPEGFVKVTFVPTENGTLEGNGIFWVNPEKEVTIPVKDPVGSGTNTFVEWKIGENAEGDKYTPSTPKKFENDTTITAVYTTDVIEQTDPNKEPDEKPEGTPDNFVKVTVQLTDKALVKNGEEELTGDAYTRAITRIFWVNPNKEVSLPVTKPVGKDVPVGQDDPKNPKAYKWVFTKWTSNEKPVRTWDDNISDGIVGTFTKETTITAQYEKKVTDQGLVIADEITVHESFKDGDTWVNNFIDTEATEAILKGALKVNGSALPSDATVAFLDDTGNAYADEAALNAALYDKLQEKDDGNNPYRTETIKAKVTFANKEVQNVEIPIKVIKNIYEAKTLTERPIYVPENYVKVTLDPTTKAENPQKTYFYVNPQAQVLIPGSDPNAVSGFKFVNWTIPGKDDDGNPINVVYDLKKRHQFKEETTITANYANEKDIIQYDPKKPVVKPDGYVTVSFDADLGLKLTEVKFYHVKIGAKGTNGEPLTLAALTKPKYQPANGYEFNSWDKADTTEIGDKDIVVTAKAKQVSSPSKPGDGPGYGPSYPEVVYRDRVVEKEKIVEKIVHVDDGMNKEIRYMQGFDGFFRPYDGLSRAEAAQILANALREDGYVYNPNFVLPYSDVGDMWYTEAVKVVTEAGVFKGDGNGLFKPTDKITRAEWIATLRRFQNLQEANGNTMNLKAGHWATNEVQAAYEAGWLDIYQNGIAKFASDEPITRQEVAAVSNKAFRRVLDKIYIDRNYKGLINYKDIDSSMALYEDILCASNTFLHDGKHYRAHGVLYKEIKFDHKTVFNIDTDDLKISQDKFQYILR